MDFSTLEIKKGYFCTLQLKGRLSQKGLGFISCVVCIFTKVYGMYETFVINVRNDAISHHLCIS